MKVDFVAIYVRFFLGLNVKKCWLQLGIFASSFFFNYSVDRHLFVFGGNGVKQ